MSTTLIIFLVLLVLLFVVCMLQAKANRKVDEAEEASECDPDECIEHDIFTLGGISYRVYVSSNGNRYILRKSKNDKYYRYYLDKK